MVATRDPKLAALILISGEYDFTDYDFKSLLKDNWGSNQGLNEETDGSKKALQERSALLFSEKIKSPTLILPLHLL